MTDFEFKFPRQVTAGSKAFQMGILRQNNPYSDKRNKEAWDRGYNAAKRKYEADRYKAQKEAQEEAIKAGFEPKSTTKLRNPARNERRPFIPSNGQLNKFNNKFRTAAA